MDIRMEVGEVCDGDEGGDGGEVGSEVRIEVWLEVRLNKMVRDKDGVAFRR